MPEATYADNSHECAKPNQYNFIIISPPFPPINPCHVINSVDFVSQSFSTAVILSALPSSSPVTMESTSFCRAAHNVFPLPPIRTAVNPFAFSASSSFNGKPLFSNRECHRNSTPLSGSGSKCNKTKTLLSSSSNLRMKITCGGVQEINETEFSDVVLKSNRPVLVEFVATWCGPCRLIAPAIDALAQV